MNIHMKECSAKHIANALTKASQSGDNWNCCCPAHDDENPSLSVSEGENDIILVKCHAGCSQEEIIEELKELGLWPPGGRACTTYDYVDANRNLLHLAIRYRNKEFKQIRPDGNSGWVWNLKGVEKVPYRLPEVLAAIKTGETIFIPEGEKDCENLAELRLTATTNSGGAGNWKDELSKYLTGAKEVFILPDNDKKGHDHANKVAASLSKLGIAVKIVPLSNLPPKGDVSDWLAAGGTKEQLLQLCADAPVWIPDNSIQEQDETEQSVSPKFNDIGNGERFKNKFGTEVLWVKSLGKFFVWNGRNWVIDELEKVFDYAKQVARSIFEEANYG